MSGLAFLASFSRFVLNIYVLIVIFCFIYYIFRLRLAVTNQIYNMRNITTYKPLFIKATPCLYGEPMKKKKKLDPMITKMREERRKKKIEKQIKRLEKNARQLKPVDELEIPFVLLDEKDKRSRPPVEITAEQKEYRQLLQKQWTKYCQKEYIADVTNIDRIISSQTKALQALKEESEELYNAALELDLTLLPYSSKGPVATPPIKNYDSPDGEYVDVSKKWES